MGWRTVMVGGSPGRTLVRGLLMGALVLLVSRTVALPVRARGISMLPTYHDGQLLFFNTLAYRLTSPKRGDVVAITMEGRQAVLVKRLIGLPGEHVRINEGTVFINGIALPEPYVLRGRPWNVEEAALGDAEYYVIGDNRSMKLQDHTFGIVPSARILARIVF